MFYSSSDSCFSYFFFGEETVLTFSNFYSSVTFSSSTQELKFKNSKYLFIMFSLLLNTLLMWINSCDESIPINYFNVWGSLELFICSLTHIEIRSSFWTSLNISSNYFVKGSFSTCYSFTSGTHFFANSSRFSYFEK